MKGLSTRRIVVLGLGYVGLPVARAFERAFPGTLGFDRDPERVRGLLRGQDPTGALAEAGALGALRLTSDAAALADRDLFVIAVPTPIDEQQRPDLAALEEAARVVGLALARRPPGGPRPIVVLESTGYPGLTEEFLGPAVARASGRAPGAGFALGYSPERMNPGDPEHRLERVCKVVAAQDAEALDVLAECYGRVVEAGVFRAPSIRVAEAAKVLENVQRDLNVALVNELARICQRLGLDTRSVLETAATKWNFLAFQPGLVGGHCIGVDPYWLAARAQEAGVEPRMILAGRAVNDGMAAFVVERLCAELSQAGVALAGARVGLLGVAFKPGVADVRNSRVPEVVARLRAAGLEVWVDDPRVDAAWAARVTGLEFRPLVEWAGAAQVLDAVVLAVPHPGLAAQALALARAGARLLCALQGGIEPRDAPPGVRFWRP